MSGTTCCLIVCSTNVEIRQAFFQLESDPQFSRESAVTMPESPVTINGIRTGLYDQRNDQVSLDEGERILI